MRVQKRFDWRKAVMIVIALLTVFSMLIGELLILLQPPAR